MPGDIPRLLPEGSPRLLEVLLFEGTDILYSRSCAPGLRETFRPNLPKMIFLEIAIVSKEDLLGI